MKAKKHDEKGAEDWYNQLDVPWTSRGSNQR